MKKFAFIAVLAALVTSVSSVQAKENVSAVAAKALVGVTAPEIPATVVKLMKDAPKANRASVVNALVRRVAKTNPAALRSVVVAVAKADPSMAAVAVAAAARLNPELASEYVIAACTAAPANAPEIVAVTSKVTVVGRDTLAQLVAVAIPSFSATTLAREASAIRVTITAGDAATGGTIFFPNPDAGGGVIGYTINGDEVTGDPQGATGTDPDFDDRDPNYAGAGS